MATRGSDEVVRVDADASLDALIHTLTRHAARTLGVEASACSAATVRGCDRWLSAASVAVARCDAVQDRHRLGPRYLVRSTGAPVTVPDVAADDRWPVWSHACRVQGFRSALVVPGTYGHVTVHLSLYSPGTPDWSGVTPRALGLAHGIAAVVAARDEIIELAQTMDDLLAGSRSRVVLDRAVGVVMAQRGCDASEALAHLRSLSATGDPREVAAALVAGAIGAGGPPAGPGADEPAAGLVGQRDEPAPRADAGSDAREPTVGGHAVDAPGTGRPATVG
ncbi:GAF and ANTAR domain-containing protein [Cellulomonas sp. Y8]|uniref:GAF and ANTAR domain-containing protein n=1 Tax=Cellulomonas sp. Y8 TaxID=2591145 RepID=UPI0011CB2FC1|nr:GAF and ANTAR domain-containing protein [Cellulomonas sp. Y8]